MTIDALSALKFLRLGQRVKKFQVNVAKIMLQKKYFRAGNSHYPELTQAFLPLLTNGHGDIGKQTITILNGWEYHINVPLNRVKTGELV
tara:strand:+ start:771 stop:1037 length:267 start_codon:yes stop_codon:yes gene_type:complete